MDNKTSYNFLLLLLASLNLAFFFPSCSAGPGSFNVVSFGAKAAGKSGSTKAFLDAWAQACCSAAAATVYVQNGKFLLRNAVFAGQCKSGKITIRIDGTLVAPSDYNVIGNSEYWLLFQQDNGVTINGGILDGQGTGLWACKNSGKGCPGGATSISFMNSNNVVINGLTSLNSQLYHIIFNGCNYVKMQGVRISASGTSRNTDGIHVQLSTGVSIYNTRIATGDDCVSVGPGTTNLWIENDMEEPGVQNVTVKTATFTGTQNGVKIKSWWRPSNGFAGNILFQHAVMTDVQNPIIMDQNYCSDSINCAGKVSGVKISDVTYQDIHGTPATAVAVKFDCSPKCPCSRIRMENVKLTYKNQPASASCSHADGMACGLVQPTSVL
uniref:Polygalacturonase n=1 Tax=Mangifera indica TaxID=29780 RepID=A0A514YDF8_MANIN|nr:polygalacturonase [Mangifera indica]